MKKIVILLYSIGISMVALAQVGIIHNCDFEPTAEKYCDKYTDSGYRYLQTVTKVIDGQTVTSNEATVYFMLKADQAFGDERLVIFELYEVLDAVTNDLAFVEQRRIEVDPDNNASWTVFTFKKTGNYTIRCFVDNTWIAGTSIVIWDK